MAHVANYIADYDPGSTSKPSSPVPPSADVVSDTGSETKTAGTEPYSQRSSPTPVSDKPHVWRLQSSDQLRKYQLFPKDKQLPALNRGKPLDPEKAYAHAMGVEQEKDEKGSPSSGLRLRMNPQNYARRRKVSVPEVGTMTTVQEHSMDSRMSPTQLIGLN